MFQIVGNLAHHHFCRGRVNVVCDPFVSERLREHQREAVRFMFQCVIGMRNNGYGCILADEMVLSMC